jgi:hypothetical protein
MGKTARENQYILAAENCIIATIDPFPACGVTYRGRCRFLNSILGFENRKETQSDI